jgi:hypothetical protein
MRRLIVFSITLALVVGVAVMSVNAAPTAPQREPTGAEEEEGIPKRLNRASFTIRAIRPPDCDPSNAEIYIRCLDRYLTRLARGINEALTTFDTFFKCTSYVQITQFGDEVGQTEGYEYRLPDTTVFLTTALDFTDDLNTQPFLNYYVVRPTERCIAFAQ